MDIRIRRIRIDGFTKIDDILNQLINTYLAVTSKDMKVIRDIIDTLEKKAKNFFGIGNQKQANKIKEAVCKVELLDRKNILSNPDVQIALGDKYLDPKGQENPGVSPKS